MIDIDGEILTDAEELREHLALKRTAPDYRAPASDLGYCLCGTVWNIAAIASMNFPRGTCPDCGKDATAIESATVVQFKDKDA